MTARPGRVTPRPTHPSRCCWRPVAPVELGELPQKFRHISMVVVEDGHDPETSLEENRVIPFALRAYEEGKMWVRPGAGRAGA